MLSVLGIGWFWSIWLGLALLTSFVVNRLGLPGLLGYQTYPAPVYLFAAGLISVVWATVYEILFRQPVPNASATDRKPTSTGESIIPASVGLSAIVFAPFLALALERNEPVFVIIALPLALWTAPLFPLFSFGYTRGQPDIGGFAYVRMPLGLIVSAVLAAGYLVMDFLGVWTKDVTGYLLVLGLVLIAGINIGINLQRDRSAGP